MHVHLYGLELSVCADHVSQDRTDASAKPSFSTLLRLLLLASVADAPPLSFILLLFVRLS